MGICCTIFAWIAGFSLGVILIAMSHGIFDHMTCSGANQEELYMLKFIFSIGGWSWLATIGLALARYICAKLMLLQITEKKIALQSTLSNHAPIKSCDDKSTSATTSINNKSDHLDELWPLLGLILTICFAIATHRFSQFAGQGEIIFNNTLKCIYNGIAFGLLSIFTIFSGLNLCIILIATVSLYTNHRRNKILYKRVNNLLKDDIENENIGV